MSLHALLHQQERDWYMNLNESHACCSWAQAGWREGGRRRVGPQDVIHSRHLAPWAQAGRREGGGGRVEAQDVLHRHEPDDVPGCGTNSTQSVDVGQIVDDLFLGAGWRA